jgi:hypothetical protein
MEKSGIFKKTKTMQDSDLWIDGMERSDMNGLPNTKTEPKEIFALLKYNVEECLVYQAFFTLFRPRQNKQKYPQMTGNYSRNK